MQNLVRSAPLARVSKASWNSESIFSQPMERDIRDASRDEIGAYRKLPSRKIVESIFNEFTGVLFPLHLGNETMSSVDFAQQMVDTLNASLRMLQEQVLYELQYFHAHRDTTKHFDDGAGI